MPVDAEPAQTDVEDLLTSTLGVPVGLAGWTRLAPWFVVTAELVDGPPHAPAGVAVKWLRHDANDFRTDPRQMATEVAALSFLADLGLDVAPRLVAHDLGAGLVVTEDLAPRVPLAAILRRGAAADHDAHVEDERAYVEADAEVALHAFARCMGRLHAGTAGLRERYESARAELGPVDPRAGRPEPLIDDWPGAVEHMVALGVRATTAAHAEMALVRSTLLEPGPFDALSNGDSGTNNFLVDGDDGRLIDFEFAGYQHALFDLSCLAMPHPMWLTMTDPVASGLEETYRRELAAAVPHVEDDRCFGLGLVASCMTRAIHRASGLEKMARRPAGDRSRVQMVAILERAAEASVAHGAVFPALRSWCLHAADALRRQWPDTDVDLAALPPYTPRGYPHDLPMAACR